MALDRSKRLGGFDRKALIGAMPTGTVWLDQGAVDPVADMHGGGIATIAVQYACLQSPLARVIGLDRDGIRRSP